MMYSNARQPWQKEQGLQQANVLNHPNFADPGNFSRKHPE